MNLCDTRLRPSTVQLLAHHGIFTVSELRRYTDAELLELNGVGRKHIIDIRMCATYLGHPVDTDRRHTAPELSLIGL